MQSLSLVLLLGALACLAPSRVRAEAPSGALTAAASVQEAAAAPADAHVPLRVSLPRGPLRDAPPREPARAPLYKNVWLWTGIGAFVAAAAIGLGLGLRREARPDAPVSAAPLDTVKGP